MKPSPRSLALVLLLGAGVIMWQAIVWSRGNALGALHETARQNLDLYAAHLEGELAKFEYLPALLSTQYELVRLLREPRNPYLIQRVNRFLALANGVAGASDTYLMDADGLTLAASNWEDPLTFVGKNFSFRPYFAEAIAGDPGRYYALGTTSQQRGYYFSYPVREDGEVLGVIAVKLSVAPVEFEWANALGEFLVTDPDGVIFITTRPEWRFRSLAPLDPGVVERIRRSRRYANVQPTPLQVVDSEPHADRTRLLTVHQAAYYDPFGDPGEGIEEARYLMHSMPMPSAGWTVHALTSLAPVTAQMRRTALFTAVILAALLSVGLFLAQRQATHRQRRRYERQAKLALEGNEARIRAIIDGTRAGLVTVDVQGRIDSFNPTAESLFGRRAGHFTGRPFLDLIGPDDRPGCAEMLETPVPSGADAREVSGLRADGSRFPMELTLDPLPVAGGKLIATIHDLTERKEQEAALQRAHDELERRVLERTADLVETNERLVQEIGEHRETELALRRTQEELIQAAKLAALGQMSAGINHELNQPLAAIRTYADNARLLLEKSRTEEARWNLEQIGQLTGRMAQIVTQLKAFARKSTGQSVAVSLPAAVDGALAVLRVDRGDFDLVREFPDEELFVLADMVRLEQVLVNLIGNAQQAIEGRATRRIELHATADHEAVILTVRDTGPGIASEHLDKVFDPFFSTKEVGQGLGLGLSISYRIIDGFGGTIRARNHPDGGAEFIVRLPRAHDLQEKSA
ncbi:MAG: ATP-binding protein [Gammaproteobacteria bacterium]|nr:ATP-binding protein [Gammaproteobacteria bacterium]